MNVYGRVNILEATAQESIDVVEVADRESKLMKESVIKLVIHVINLQRSNPFKPEGESA